jgi:outer membrane protein assembly factor BamD
MKKSIIYIVLIITCFASCSQFEKLRRSNDYALKYRRAFEYYHAGDYVRASTLFDNIFNVYRGTNRADTVAFYQAMSHLKQRDYLTASHYFNRLFREHRTSPFAEESEYLAGYCYYMQSPRPSLDQSNTHSAIDAFQLFLIRHPSSEFAEDARKYLTEMRDKLVDKSYLTAVLYYNLGQYRASIIALNNSLEDYPETKHREELMYLLLRSSFLLAENSIPARRLERYQSTVDEYYSFLAEFPESKYNREAQRIYQRSDRFIKARATGEELED